MAGYSETPLAKKLGIKEGFRVFLVGAPAQYRALLAPLPERVRFTRKADSSTNLVHTFSTERGALARLLPALRKKLSHEAAIWVSWPKKSSKVPTDITEDTIREVALPLGFVLIRCGRYTFPFCGTKTKSAFS